METSINYFAQANEMTFEGFAQAMASFMFLRSISYYRAQQTSRCMDENQP